MGLFNFSGNHDIKYEKKDLVWLNQHGKQVGCLNLLKQSPDALIIAWFTKTQEEFTEYLNVRNGASVDIQLARSASSMQSSKGTIIFLEHCPIFSKEKDLIQSLNPEKVYFLSALDEPLINHFGGDKITQMMRNMGMKEDEQIEHAMISKAIENLQNKIEKEVTVENSANSQEEWLERNYKK